MIPLFLSAALAGGPAELDVLPVFHNMDAIPRGGSSRFDDMLIGARLRARVHGTPWATFHVDTALYAVRMFRGSRAIRPFPTRLRASVGPRFRNLNLRVRAGAGRDPVVIFETRPTYTHVDTLELGAEAAMDGGVARVLVGGTVFGGLDRPLARSYDLEVTIPNHHVWAMVVAFDHQVKPPWTLPDGQNVVRTVEDRLAFGIRIRPRMERRSAPEK